MLALGARRRAAGGAALLFIVYPAHFEAVFWLAALPTMLASAAMLALLLLMTALARHEQPGRTTDRLWFASLLTYPAAAFTICCLNEQPAMGVLALPLVYWCQRSRTCLASDRESPTPETPADHASGSSNLRCALLRAGVPTLLAGLAVLLYAWLLLTDPNKPAGARGSAEHLVTLSQLPARTLYFLDVLWRRLALRNFAAGAFHLGWSEIRSVGAPGLLFAAAVVVAGIAWTIRWWRAEPAAPPPAPPSASPPRPALISLTGLWLSLSAWAPIFAMTNYDPDPRTRYWPCLGAAIAVAGLGSLISRSPRIARALRTVLAPLLLAAILAGSICMVGTQAAFRARWRLDHDQAAQLRALLPNPEPLTFFVPLEIRTTGVRTGSPVLDTEFRSPWEFPWTAPRFIMSVYGRDDVRCGYWRSWTPRAPVRAGDRAGLHYTARPGPGYDAISDTAWLIPWPLAAPFIIDDRGQVHLITTIILTGPGAQELRIDLPQAARAKAPPLTARLPGA
jgi:hypothetical protein